MPSSSSPSTTSFNTIVMKNLPRGMALDEIAALHPAPCADASVDADGMPLPLRVQPLMMKRPRDEPQDSGEKQQQEAAEEEKAAVTTTTTSDTAVAKDDRIFAGTVFLEYASPDAAATAMQMLPTACPLVVGGRKVYFEPSRVRFPPQPPNNNNNQGLRPRNGRREPRPRPSSEQASEGAQERPRLRKQEPTAEDLAGITWRVPRGVQAAAATAVEAEAAEEGAEEEAASEGSLAASDVAAAGGQGNGSDRVAAAAETEAAALSRAVSDMYIPARQPKGPPGDGSERGFHSRVAARDRRRMEQAATLATEFQLPAARVVIAGDNGGNDDDGTGCRVEGDEQAQRR